MPTGLDAVDIGGQDIAIQAARNCRALCERGITICKTMDTLIATRCIESDYALLSTATSTLSSNVSG